jgi:hypothetical protein
MGKLKTKAWWRDDKVFSIPLHEYVNGFFSKPLQGFSSCQSGERREELPKTKVYFRNNYYTNKYLGGKKYFRTKCDSSITKLIYKAIKESLHEESPGFYDIDFLIESYTFWVGKVAELMEDKTNLMKAYGDAIAETGEKIRTMYEALLKSSEKTIPQLAEMIDEVNDFKGSFTHSLKESLEAMMIIQKVFEDNRHKKTMKNVKEFCDTAERLKKLIDDGTIDAITNIMKKEVI